MSDPRDHHFLPVFYLDQWAGPDGKLIEYSRPYAGKLIAKPIGPKGTAFQRDLYAFPELPGSEAQYVERVFLNIADSDAAQAFQLLLSGKQVTWTTELRSGWSRFILGSLHRHPHTMQEIRAALADVWNRSSPTTQKKYEAVRQPDDPPTFEEYWAKNDPLVPARAQLRLLLGAIMDNDRIGSRTNDMIWKVLDVADAPYTLLTSDRPLSRHNLNKQSGFVVFPLSPSKLFVGAYQRETIAQIEKNTPRKLVTTANKEVVERARIFVYARDTKQTQFVQRYMSTNMEIPPFYPNLGQSPRSQGHQQRD